MGVVEYRGKDFTRIIEMTPELRSRIEATVEHLIALLDQYDGDPDLEGSLADHQEAMRWDGAAACDLELDDADDEDGHDAEGEEWSERWGQGPKVNVYGDLVQTI